METVRIEHINKETSKKFLIELKKPFVVIYGKNGSGKTTISRNEIFDKNYVFNTDYIHRNVYIESSSGTKDDTHTKESFSSLWLGEDIVAVKNSLDKSKEILNKINEKEFGLKAEISATFNKYRLISPDYSRINNLCESVTVETNLDEDLETKTNSFVSKISLNQVIKSDEQLNEKYTVLKNNNILTMFINDIKQDDLFSEIYLSDNQENQQKLFNSINEYNENLIELAELEVAFKSSDKTLENKWIQEAIKLHENINFCLFCGNEDINIAKEKWKKVLSSTVKEKKEKILSEIEFHLSKINTIQNHCEEYIKTSPKIIESIMKLNEDLILLKKYITENKFVDFQINFYKGDKSILTSNVKTIYDECHDYLFKNYLSRYEIIYHLKQKCSETINLLEEDLTKKMDANAINISKNINKILTELGLSKELEVKLEKRGNDKKYNFGFKNKKTSIKTLSDGQKHKLALAIFLASIQNQGIKDKVIVLDDPVVTLDQRTYYAVRTKIMHLSAQDPKTILLMTHNIGYMQIQLSNLFNSNILSDNVAFYHLLGDTIREIDPNILNYDDLTLYKKALSEITSHKEFSVLATINIRMYRYFLDHYLRILGIPSIENPIEEIDKIDIDMDSKIKLKEINLFIEKKCKDLNANYNDLYLTFEKLNEFIAILGYPKLINNEEIEKLKNFKANNIRTIDYDGDNIIFQILFWVHCAMLYKDNNYKDIKNYISHPRHQMTSSIVGVDFYNSELNDFKNEK